VLKFLKMIVNPFRFIQYILGWIFLLFDSIIYGLLSTFFDVYIALAQFRIFDNEVFKDLVNRVYILIGVIALFIVAYALINAIINPDNAGKGDKSLSKILRNLAFAIVGVALIPTAFDYAYYFQRVVLCNNTIPRLLLHNTEKESLFDEDSISDGEVGTQFSINLFSTFFYPASVSNDTTASLNFADTGDSNNPATKISVSSISLDISDWFDGDGIDANYTLAEGYSDVVNGKHSIFEALAIFISDTILSDNNDQKVNYIFLVSTIVGGYCLYVIISLCIDMAIRAAKLGYLELIAPLPVMMLIVPGQKKMFDSWIKKTLSTFFEVFTRLFVIILVLYLISTVNDLFTGTSIVDALCKSQPGLTVTLLMRAFIFCGLLIFAKQAPKFFSEATGIKSDGWKLGIADKLGEMALIGGAVKGGINSVKGAATGALGGATTGIMNRKRIDLSSAVRQGAANGFKKGGNQFSKQRKATFQSIPEFSDKEQGLFGGVSFKDKIVDANKKAVSNSYKDQGARAIQNASKSENMKKIRDKFTAGERNKRIKNFESKDIYKQAESVADAKVKAAKDVASANGVTLTADEEKDIRKKARASYFENIGKNTNDKNLKRLIKQYQNDTKKETVMAYQDLDDIQNERTTLINDKATLTSKEAKLRSGMSDARYQKVVKDAQTFIDGHQAIIDADKSTLDVQTKSLDTTRTSLQNTKNRISTNLNTAIPGFNQSLLTELNNAKNSTELATAVSNIEAAMPANLINGQTQQIRSDLKSIISQSSTIDTLVTSTEKLKQNITSEESIINSSSKKMVLEKHKKNEEEYQKTVEKLEETNDKLNGNASKGIESIDDKLKAASVKLAEHVETLAEAVYKGDGTISDDGTDFIDTLTDKNAKLETEIYRDAAKNIEKAGAAKSELDLLKDIASNTTKS